MHLALDLSCLARPRRTGIGWYATHLVQELARLDQQNSYTLCYRLSRWRERRYFLPLPGPNFRQKLIQEPLNWLFPRTVDLFHGLDAKLPEYRRVPRVVTLHDVFSLVSSEFSAPEFVAHKRAEYRRLTEQADRIIAVSEATRRDFLFHFNFPEERISVVHQGVGPEFHPRTPAEIADLRERLGLTRPYLLFVGNIARRKNTAHMVAAFAALPRELRGELEFVFCGSPSDGYSEFRQAVELHGLEERVRHLPYAERADLPVLYGGAELFVFTTLYEGFGMPILEAMACGVPTLVSDVSSHPEVAGGAALLANPSCIESISAALAAALSDRPRLEALRRAGLVRARQFSWEKTAAETYAVYQNLLPKLPELPKAAR